MIAQILILNHIQNFYLRLAAGILPFNKYSVCDITAGIQT